MAVGVGLVMSMVAWMDGMYVKMFDVIVEQTLGHVQVHHPDYPEQRQLYDTVTGGRRGIGHDRRPRGHGRGGAATVRLRAARQ